ncbi:unnamed protein product [Sphagnum balticum]
MSARKLRPATSPAPTRFQSGGMHVMSVWRSAHSTVAGDGARERKIDYNLDAHQHSSHSPTPSFVCTPQSLAHHRPFRWPSQAIFASNSASATRVRHADSK